MTREHKSSVAVFFVIVFFSHVAVKFLFWSCLISVPLLLHSKSAVPGIEQLGTVLCGCDIALMSSMKLLG